MARKRKLFAIYSIDEEWTASPPRWEAEYMAAIACGRCLGPRRGYPFQPIPQYIMKRPLAPICMVMNTAPCILSEEFSQAIEPYLQDVAWGPVFLERDELIGPLKHRSYYVKPDRCIVEKRTPFARHRLCDCGAIIDCNQWAKPGVVASSLDERLIYQDTMGFLFIDSTLAMTLELPSRFPLLDLWPIKVIDNPLDGDVLPGDPGWSGTLIERPIEVPDMSTPFAKKWAY